jgi:hypothetical protein
MGAKRNPTKRFVFNKTKLAAVPPPAKGRIYVHDRTVPGLCMCVTQPGSMTFYVYKWLNGAPQRIRLGKFPDTTVEQARNRARAIVGNIAQGSDPASERRRARTVPRVDDLFERWKEVYATGRVKTVKESERVFKIYLHPFHNRRVNSITSSEVSAWHSRLGDENGRYQANRALQLLRGLYNRAREVTGTNAPTLAGASGCSLSVPGTDSWGPRS